MTWEEDAHPRGEHGKWAHLAGIGRSEHPNVTEYRSGGIGHLPGDESRSVVGFMDPKALIPYREHSGIQNPGAGDHDEKRIGEIQHDIESGEGIHEPISVEWDANRQHAYIGEGNHRLEAALRAGAQTVPVRVNGRGHAERQINEGVGAPLTHTGDFEDDGRPVPGYAPPAVHPAHFDWDPAPVSGRHITASADTLQSGGGLVADKPTPATTTLAGTCTGPGPCDVHPLGHGKNWVTKVGGLPEYIRAIAHALQRQGHDEQRAIATAVATVKRWSAGGGKVSAATRARAAKAVSEWEAKKAAASVADAESFALATTEDDPAVEQDVTHSGLALKAADTGRVLMLQRGIDTPDDPAAGKWEFPGGGMEPDDTTTLHGAVREWQEEVGQPLPKGGVVAETWTAPNGIYQGHVVVIPEEKSVVLHEGRQLLNPDDPHGGGSEQVAWWDPDDAAQNPALREEVKTTPWDLIKNAGAPLSPVEDDEEESPAGRAVPEVFSMYEFLSAFDDEFGDDEEFAWWDAYAKPPTPTKAKAAKKAPANQTSSQGGSGFNSKHPRDPFGKFAPLGQGAGYTSDQKGQRENIQVKAVQKMLLHLGISVGPEGVDGMLGPHTRVGVEDFQRRHGLGVNGVVDRKTLEAMKVAAHVKGSKAKAKKAQAKAKRQQRIPGLRPGQAPGMLPDSAIPRQPVSVSMPGYRPNPIVADGTSFEGVPAISLTQPADPGAEFAAPEGKVYHYKHGWVSLDHPAAKRNTGIIKKGNLVHRDGEVHEITGVTADRASIKSQTTGKVRHLPLTEVRSSPIRRPDQKPPEVAHYPAVDDIIKRMRAHGLSDEESALTASADTDEAIAALVAAAITEQPPIELGEDVGGGVPFKIPLVLPTGIETGDRREFKAGGVSSRDLPIPLLWQRFTDDGHKQASIVGRIDKIEPTKNGLGNAEGVFDTGVDATEALRLVRGLFLRGVSGDVDKIDAEMSQGDDGKPKVMFDKGRLTAATLVAKPAFAECMIELPGDKEWESNMGRLREEGGAPTPLVAAGGPMNPPSEWFQNPNLTEPTHLEVTDDGRVFGHIAAWNQDHIGMPFQKPPRSNSGYRYFTTGQVKTAEGDLINVGQLTLVGGHADLTMTADMAVKHYDDTNSAVADVVVGEDQFGIWVAGAQRPDLSEHQVRAFRASDPSGDWRPINGNLELVACCQVNVPGFPIPRARVASAAAGSPVITALVAAGAIARHRDQPADALAARVAALEAVDNRRRMEVAQELRATVAAGKAMLIKQTKQALVASADDLAAVEFDSPIFEGDPDTGSEDMTGVETDDVSTAR